MTIGNEIPVIRSKFLEGLMTVQNVVFSKGTLQILSMPVHVEDNQMLVRPPTWLFLCGA